MGELCADIQELLRSAPEKNTLGCGYCTGTHATHRLTNTLRSGTSEDVWVQDRSGSSHFFVDTTGSSLYSLVLLLKEQQ